MATRRARSAGKSKKTASGARRAGGTKRPYSDLLGHIQRDFTAAKEVLGQEVDRAVDQAKKKLEEKGVDPAKMKRVEAEFQTRMSDARARLARARAKVGRASRKVGTDERVQAAADAGLSALHGLAGSLKGLAARVEHAVGAARDRNQARMDPAEAAAARDRLLGEIEVEHKRTIACIEHLPEGKLGFTPHAKLRSFAAIALHIYHGGEWFLRVVESGKVSFDTWKPPVPPEKKAELLADCERLQRDLVRRMKALTPEQLGRPIEFPGKGARAGVAYFTWHLFHHIHHRGQLTVYLRLMGAKVPAVYGDSADYPG